MEDLKDRVAKAAAYLWMWEVLDFQHYMDEPLTGRTYRPPISPS